MTTDPLAALELRHHVAIPGWCKLVGLEIRAVPECEGGGFMIRRDQAERIATLTTHVAALRSVLEAVRDDGTFNHRPITLMAVRDALGGRDERH